MRVPWIPLVVLVGIVGAVGLVIYLVIQANQPASEANEAALAAEADASDSLPGEWVNLAEIYGEGYSSTGTHVRQDVDYAADQELPPVGGHHWGHAGACPPDPTEAPVYCGPVPWGFYTEEWRAETLVHNMEHTGVVVWYNTTDQEIIDDLRDFASDNQSRYLVIAPYSDMEEETVAITAWSRRDKFPAEEYDRDRLKTFFDAHECRFDPEDFCG